MTSGDPVASRRRRWPQRASRMFPEKRDTSDGTRVKNRTALTMTATHTCVSHFKPARPHSNPSTSHSTSGRVSPSGWPVD